MLHSRPKRVLNFKRLLPALLFATAAFTQPAYDRYGGFTAVKREATGFFRIERIGSRWIFITPEGHPYVALGSNHIGKFLDDANQSAAILARFEGSRERAEASVAAAIRDLNLNAGEAYSPLLPSLKQQFPYIEDIPFPGNEKFRFDIFDPQVRQRLRLHVAGHCRRFSANPMVLGVGFADLPVWTSPRMAYIRNLPAAAPGKARYVEWLRLRYPDVQALNGAYGASFAMFDDALAPFAADAARPAVKRDDEEFLGIVADSLYSLLREAVRESAPHHLFFGEKFVLRLYPDAVLKAVGRHVDVLLTQALILSPQRPPEWQVFQPDGARHDFALAGKPMVIVDWALPFSLDTPYETSRGNLKPERESAEDAARWLGDALREPYIAGAFQCQLIGTHGNDRWFPAGRMKRTYLRDDGVPFAARASIMARAHAAVLERIYGDLAKE